MADYTLQTCRKSIHIVIFTGGKSPSPASVSSYFSRSPAADFVIAADSGLETCRKFQAYFKTSYNFTPQCILGDFDSISDKRVLAEYASEIVQKFSCDKDWTDTEIAIENAYKKAAHENSVPYITLIGGDGGRIDHLLAVYDTFSSEKHASVWLLAKQAVWFLEKNAYCEIYGLKSNDIISIARTDDCRSGGKIHTEGLEWESSVFRSSGMPSISNRISDKQYEAGKPVKITVQEKPFLLVAPLSADVRFPLKAQ